MVSRIEIVSNATRGTLHHYIVENYERGRDEDAAFVVEAIDLHNAGEIDLLATATPAALSEVAGFQFFTLQHFYCKAIPSLEADPLRLMESVDRLVTAGGQDMAAFQPNGAFRDWCAATAGRVEEVLRVIESNIPQTKGFLSLTLDAGGRSDAPGYLAKAISYIRDIPDLRLGALTSLARIDSSTSPELAEEALKLIASLLTEDADDMLRTHILVAAINLYVRSPASLHERALAVVQSALSQGGNGVLDRGASALLQHRNELSDDFIELLLTALEGVNPANKGTISSLDGALSQLLDGVHGIRVSSLLEKLLLAHPNALALKEFQGVGNELLMNRRALLDDMVVRWLMSGESALADAISHLVGSVGGEPVIFNIDLGPYGLSDQDTLFLARKAVGWFFFHPITAASLLICILRIAKGETADKVGALLFEPLLLNYSGELREYLAARLKGARDKAKPQIRRALDKLKTYIGDLRSTGFIAELEPSERDRLIERQRRNEEVRQLQKAVEEASVFMKFIPKSIILYGNASVSYVRDNVEKLHRNYVKMGGISTTWEVPRLQSIDPFILEAQLRTFRAERPKP
ncbi:MAG TPA: hypothetical protein VFW19_01000 [Allosphingosinicella sp.]|nr:hypothetical protein [Allosphingosinicella sp.]